MTKDFDSINRQIASFIIVTSALAAPVYADGGMGGNMLVPQVQQEIIARYAGPGMGGSWPSIGIVEPIDRYAGPVVPIVEPQPMPVIIARYAGPVMPPEPQVQVQESSSTDINRSVLNPINNVEHYSNLNPVSGYKANKVAPGHFIFE